MGSHIVDGIPNLAWRLPCVTAKRGTVSCPKATVGILLAGPPHRRRAQEMQSVPLFWVRKLGLTQNTNWNFKKNLSGVEVSLVTAALPRVQAPDPRNRSTGANWGFPPRQGYFGYLFSFYILVFFLGGRGGGGGRSNRVLVFLGCAPI